MTQTIPKDSAREISSIRADELQERISRNETLQVIDVREFPEFAAGHIACAQLLPLNELEPRADQLDRNVPLVCVCRSGKRSAEAVRKLRALGFRHITQLEGGLPAWEQMGLPVRRDAHAPWSLERQVRFALGFFVLAGLALSLRWQAAITVAWIIGVGMMFTAVIDWCGMALLLAKAPWNKGGACRCGK
jgi:rhodanese-related sulfurtransferase